MRCSDLVIRWVRGATFILEQLPHLFSLVVIELLNLHQSRASILFSHNQFVRQSCLTGPNGMERLVLREANAQVAAATQPGFTDEVASLLWEDFGMS